jgi:hypothetical protein
LSDKPRGVPAQAIPGRAALASESHTGVCGSGAGKFIVLYSTHVHQCVLQIVGCSDRLYAACAYYRYSHVIYAQKPLFTLADHPHVTQNSARAPPLRTDYDRSSVRALRTDDGIIAGASMPVCDPGVREHKRGKLTTHPTTLRNSQAGCSKCERIHPGTGKPCNLIFSRRSDLTRHEDSVHNVHKQKLRCHLCTKEKEFSRNDSLTRHIRLKHKDTNWPGTTRRKRGCSGQGRVDRTKGLKRRARAGCLANESTKAFQ